MLINEKVIKKIQKIRVFFTHPICQLLSYCPAASQRHRKLDFLATHFFLVAKLFQSKIFKGAWQFVFYLEGTCPIFLHFAWFFPRDFCHLRVGGGWFEVCSILDSDQIGFLFFDSWFRTPFFKNSLLRIKLFPIISGFSKAKQRKKIVILNSRLIFFLHLSIICNH